MMKELGKIIFCYERSLVLICNPCFITYVHSLVGGYRITRSCCHVYLRIHTTLVLLFSFLALTVINSLECNISQLYAKFHFCSVYRMGDVMKVFTICQYPHSKDIKNVFLRNLDRRYSQCFKL